MAVGTIKSLLNGDPMGPFYQLGVYVGIGGKKNEVGRFRQMKNISAVILGLRAQRSLQSFLGPDSLVLDIISMSIRI